MMIAMVTGMIAGHVSFSFANPDAGLNTTYTVKYLRLKVRDRDPEVELAKSQVFTGKVGETISVEALDMPGWIPDSNKKDIILQEGKNEIEFRYSLNVGLLITGKGLSKDIYYTRNELKNMADDEQNIIRNYSIMKRGGIPAILMGKGFDLISVIERAGIVGNGTLRIVGKAVDGWAGGDLSYDPATQSFNMDCYYYPNIFTGNTQGAELIMPMLAFYNVEDLENVPEIPATKDGWGEVMNFPNPMIMYGQASIDDYNNQNFGKMLMAIQVGGIPDNVLTIGGKGLESPKSYKLDEILRMGLESKVYGSNKREGVSLSRIFSDAGVAKNTQIQIKSGNQKGKIIIDASAIDKSLLSLNVKDNIVDKNSPLSIYYEKDGAEAVIENVTGIISGEDGIGKPTPTLPDETKKDDKGKPATASLIDIKGHWAEEFVTKLVSTDAIKGYPDNTFKPNNNITRAEFATVLVKAFNLETKAGKVFADTKAHWAKDFIATAEANGIVSGYDQNKFGANDPITREQMAVMITKALKINPQNSNIAFADKASISTWAKDSVAAAVEKEIIKGYPDNTFKPSGKATRAEAVTVIVKAIQ